MNSIFVARPELIWKRSRLSVPYSKNDEYAEPYFFKMIDSIRENLEISHCIFISSDEKYTPNIKSFLEKYSIADCKIEAVIEQLLGKGETVYIMDDELLKLENKWRENLFEIDYKINHNIDKNSYMGYSLKQKTIFQDDITKTFVLKALEDETLENLNNAYSNIEIDNDIENEMLDLEVNLSKYKYESTKAAELEYEVLDQKDRIDDLLISACDKIYFKCIYDGEKAYYGNPISIAFSIDDTDRVYYAEFSDIIESEVFKEKMSDASIKKYGHHAKDDLILFKRYEVKVEGLVGDTMIASYILDPSIDDYGVEYIAREYIDQKILSEEELLGKGKQKKSYSEIETKSLQKYLCKYVYVLKNSNKQLEKRIKDLNMSELYNDIEMPLVEVLADMEYEGVKVDLEGLQKLKTEFEMVVDGLKTNIYILAGKTFNINSPKQLGEVLFEEIGLPVIKKTKTGYSTNAEVLDKLLDKHEIIPMILEYRKLSKLISTYVDGLAELIDENGKIHSSFNQAITTTGRISSTQPNLQNIPVRTKEGRLIRKVFIPSERRNLVDADYSQIELRVLAHISKDQNLQKAYIENEDIHTKTAAEVFFVDPKDVTDNQRRVAKAVNFGIVYGISDFGLSRDLKISLKEAKTYIDAYLKLYSEVDKYMQDIIADAKEKGYVETIFGRRRYIPELNASNKNIQSFGERIALNTPIQGSAADIIKLAMVRVYKALKDENLKSKLILQVHDELIIDAYLDEIDSVQILLKREMENVLNLDIPLSVDMKAGENWYETK